MVSYLANALQIVNDLNYVAQYWNQTGFDLWEEVRGSSFFTLQAQYRALLQGIGLAHTFGTDTTGFESQSPQIGCFLRSFWDGSKVVANINTESRRSGIDVSFLLGALTAFDVHASGNGTLLQPSSPKILASHKALTDAFRRLYPINRRAKTSRAVHIGRYPEDVYERGQAWYLATFAAAEVLYAAIAQWKAQGFVTVDQTSYPFFKGLKGKFKRGTYKADDSSPNFSSIINAVSDYADDFLFQAFRYIPESGDLSEQYSRSDGHQLSAKNLTWSYAAFLTASSRRAGFVPRSWGAKDVATEPVQCDPSPFKGVYEAAIAAGAPERGNLCTITVELQLHARTYWGEQILVYGSDEFGEWCLEGAWPLSAGDYSEKWPVWKLRLELPAGAPFAYKYIRRSSTGALAPERQERRLQVSDRESKVLVVKDKWRD